MVNREVLPPRDLGGRSNNWGRKIEERSFRQESDHEQLANVVRNQGLAQSGALAAITSQLKVMSDQQAALTTQQATLTSQQATLTSQQSTLASQQSTLASQQTSLASQQTQITDTINSIPISNSNGTSVSPITANASNWVTKASVTFTVPAGRRRATVFGTGTASLIDRTTAGVSTMQGRITISGVQGPEPFSSKEYGASVVNNTVNVMSSRTWTVTPGATVTVALQVTVSNTTAFATSYPGNFAQIVATASFS